jgi:hypothetical protein
MTEYNVKGDAKEENIKKKREKKSQIPARRV